MNPGVIEYLQTAIKIADTGLGWNTNDPIEKAFWQGAGSTARMTLMMMRIEGVES